MCETAYGKSNIFNILSEKKIETHTLIVADGAAFGSQMNRIERFFKNNPFLHLYLPESFEWIILKSGLIEDKEIQMILENLIGRQ